MTLLRLLHAVPLPAGDLPTPRVLSVDDWAFRRGRTYGTILVDLERHRPVDLWPDRTAETVASWLHTHPGVEIASRDRGGASAEGIRQGAPDAVQVADRFHLLTNLGDALEAFLLGKQAILRQAAHVVRLEHNSAQPALPATAIEQQAEPMLVPAPEFSAVEDVGVGSAGQPRTVRAQREREARRTRRLARYEAVRAHACEGMTQREIARAVGLARGAVRRSLRAEAFPEQGPRARLSNLGPYEPYLRAPWDAGVQDAAVLWRALKAQGCTGCASRVRAFLARWPIQPPESGPVQTGRRPHNARIPVAPPRPCTCSPHRTRWLLVRPDLIHNTIEEQLLKEVLQLCPQIAQGRTLLQDFAALIYERQDCPEHAAGKLGAWLVAAEHSGIAELRGVAGGVRRDLDAVTAALTLDWSQGQTEGQVNRLKTLKRQMYGQASFLLLRQRLLHSA